MLISVYIFKSDEKNRFENMSKNLKTDDFKTAQKYLAQLRLMSLPDQIGIMLQNCENKERIDQSMSIFEALLELSSSQMVKHLKESVSLDKDLEDL